MLVIPSRVGATILFMMRLRSRAGERSWHAKMNSPSLVRAVVLIAVIVLILPWHASASAVQEARWAQEAKNVTIVRDDWGIAHVYGKTDADAVFGMIYAQSEDDFNRVETNYLNAMGRLAETEGEDKVYQDLRMKMFIDPEVIEERVCEPVRSGSRS